MKTLLFALALIGLAPVCFLLPGAILKAIAVRRLKRKCTGSGVVVLTYDDGPHPVTTGPVLCLLRKYRVKASFFPLGMRAEKNSRMLNQILQERHEIGSHSYRHCDSWKSAPWTAVRDIERGRIVLSSWTGSGAWFRPPHGRVTLVTLIGLLLTGTPIAWWTDDSGDSLPVLPQASEVVRKLMADGGGILLLHDHHGDPARAGYVLQVTELVLREAIRKGVRIVLYSELDTVSRSRGKDGSPFRVSRYKKV